MCKALAVMVMLLLFGAVSTVLAAAEGAGSAQRFEDLGPQITSKLVQGAAFTVERSGRLVVCAVVRGTPGKFVVMDAGTGKVEHVFPLNDAHGAWNATTATDGSVYVGTDPKGRVFRWVPGEEKIRDLGVAIDGWAWDVCPGKEGEVFISTYPRGLVVRYHPKDGFSDVGHGPLVAGENYARSVSYDAGSDTLYVGIGSHAHLMKLNPRTGEKQDITPAQIKGMDFAYTVDVLGRSLVVHTTPGTSSFLYDIATMGRRATFDNSSITHCSTKAPDSDALFYTSGSVLYRLDPGNEHPVPVEIARIDDANAFYWKNPSTLMVFGRHGRIFTVNLAGGGASTQPSVTSVAYDAPAQATLLQSTYTGPDGRIWSGGYLSGGAAAFDPATGKHEQFGNVGQPEDMTSIGRSMVFGCYPGANLWIYDTTQPWDAKKGNPRKYADLDAQGQSRPVAMLGVDQLHTIYTGTVAEYGHLDGMLAAYDVSTGALETYRDIIHNQSIISLAYCKGVIVGSTSISGGLGQAPTEKEAKLFIFDPQTKKKVFEMVPVAGKTTAGALTVGPDGNVWGLANGTLFVFDPATREIVARHEILPAGGNGPEWRAGRLVFHPNGKLYVSTPGDLASVDLKTFEVTMLRKGDAHHATVDGAGRIYFIAGETDLWRYRP